MEPEKVSELEQQIKNLIDAFTQLKQENATLKKKHATLLNKQEELSKKNYYATTEIKRMISRLKTIEGQS